jgi:hypothetical protein
MMNSDSPFAAHTEDRIDARLQHPLVPEQEGIAADALSSSRALNLALVEGLRRLAIAEAHGKFTAARIRAEKAAITRLRDLVGGHQ